MKKILSVILILTLLTLCSCKRQADDETASVYVEKQATDVADNAASPDAEKADTEADVKSEKTDTAETVEPAVDGTEVEVETKADQNDTETNGTHEITIDYITVPANLRQACVAGTDIIVGEVLSSEPVPSGTTFYSYNNTKAEPVLYTVRVKDVIKPFAVTEGTVIQVIQFIRAKDDTDYWTDALENGKDYLIGGWVEPYGDKPVILAHSLLTAEVDENGNLHAHSSGAETVLTEATTLDQIKTGEKTADVLFTEAIMMPPVFYELIEPPVDQSTAQVNSTQSMTPTADHVNHVISVLKQAIKVDSDVVITPITDGAVTE